MKARSSPTHREKHIDDPLHTAPARPGNPVLAEPLLDLPAAEFAVQPPSLRAVPELEVGQPGGHDRHERGVETDDSACE